MKKCSSFQAARTTRIVLTSILAASGVLLLVMASGAVPVVTPFTGTFDNAHAYGAGCTTIPNVFAVPAGQARILINVTANTPVDDLAVTLVAPDGSPLHTEDNGVGQEVFLYQPGGGVTPGNYSVYVCASSNPLAMQPPYGYTGTFTYDNTAASTLCTANYTPALPTPPPDNGPKIGYENFEPPGVLTPVTVTSSGGKTVEYLGRNAIEPSIGFNIQSGVAAYQSDLETLFVTFDTSCGSGQNSLWINRPAPLSILVDSDPILFTDRQTHRTWVSELTLLSPETSKIAYTDNDGVNWTPDNQIQGEASGVDHQTIGAGPYALPVPTPAISPTPGPTPQAVYPNAVYYCSQDLETAFCARSDDGGLTLGAQVPLYTAVQCGGIHGHVKVGPDGTVYLPNRDCGGTQAVVVSENSGVTWNIRPVNTCTWAAKPSLVGTGDDPALSVDAAGRVYFAFSNFGTSAGVAISEDKGNSWTAMYDVGAAYGVKNACFPTATAGDAGRAAVAFYGSSTPQGPTTGDSNTANFTGVWHLYIAHTFDGGKTWTTSDTTPLMPMQRSGLLRGGGANIVRNLADFFDMTVDDQGRVLVGYGNGCEGGPCAQAPNNPDGTTAVKGNAYSATAAIARQSSGRRMFAANDPANPLTATSKPGAPFVTETRKGNVVRLMWNEADTGNSTIDHYEIYRGTAPGMESLLNNNVPGNQTGGSFDDMTANDATRTYYYKVLAHNAVGYSCPNNEIAAPYVGDTCTGLIIHKNDPTHPESTGGTVAPPPLPQLLIDYIAVGEPPSSSNLMFKMKVGNLNSLPANSRWRISWDWDHPSTPSEPYDTQLYYIGMTTDNNGAVSFEYGTLADAGVPAILLLSETKRGDLTQSPSGTHYDPDGTITMIVPKAAVGNPGIGDLLGAIGGKTITGDNPNCATGIPGTTPPCLPNNKLERSTSFIDHTFVKGNSDNAYPAATYAIVGNTQCSTGTIVPVSAVSRKTHGTGGSARDYDIDLPLIGTPGIETRTSGGTNSSNHQVVVTFSTPVTVLDASVTPGAGKAASRIGSGAPTINGTQVTVNLNADNVQTLTVNLLGVNDGINSGDVAIPMSLLLGDTNTDRSVNAIDTSQTKSRSGLNLTTGNFRSDVNTDGAINAIDTSLVKSKSGTALP